MNRNAIPLGRIFGIRIALDYSWFLILVLLTWTLAVGYFPVQFPHWSEAEYWIIGAATAILLFVCVLLHELGHSLVARAYGIPVRNITLFLFGGVSQIEGESPRPSAEFWIAVAGPLVSLGLAGLFALVRIAAPGFSPAAALLFCLAYINVALAVFNLIPGFPLDGGRVFRAILWGMTGNLRRATVLAGNLGRLIGFLLIADGVWMMLGGSFIPGLWTAFIGWFLESAAVAQVYLNVLQELDV